MNGKLVEMNQDVYMLVQTNRSEMPTTAHSGLKKRRLLKPKIKKKRGELG